ncbi:MAG: DUF3793 family protein [Treponema phagedenis]|uniref:DUF3793 family protein n=1 Tax=Treponema phagedenis TaxID=162 RepID=UPI003133E04D
MLQNTNIEKLFAFRCAPCLAGIKPANLISLSQSFVEELAEYRECFAQKGVFMHMLCNCEQRAQILVYRKKLLEEYLSGAEVTEVLKSFGYHESGCESMLTILAQRMSRRNIPNSCAESFPHEIGLFLGYPPADVLEYIRKEGKTYLFCGYWKVYSEPEKAREIFNQYTECRKLFALQIERGISIYDLVLAA